VAVELERGLYGADADGNRGEYRNFMVGYAVDQIFDLETGHDVTEQFKRNGKVLDQIERGIR
jgi:hypothetical protein